MVAARLASGREAHGWGKTARTQVYTNQGFNINTTSRKTQNHIHHNQEVT